MISGVVSLLRIFKMFHRLTNNPVLSTDITHACTWCVGSSRFD